MDIIIQFLGQYSELEPILILMILIIFFSAFIKISTVFYILRLGLGFTGIPSILVLTSLSVSITLYVMHPTVEYVNSELNSSLSAYGVNSSSSLGVDQKKELYQNISSQWLSFMKKNTDKRHIQRIKKIDNNVIAQNQNWRILLPAFVISEITKAFKLGLTLFLPLLLVDLVISTILTAIDINNIDFSLVSLPLKLFLFISLDGWAIISTNLMKSYII